MKVSRRKLVPAFERWSKAGKFGELSNAFLDSITTFQRLRPTGSWLITLMQCPSTWVHFLFAISSLCCLAPRDECQTRLSNSGYTLFASLGAAKAGKLPAMSPWGFADARAKKSFCNNTIKMLKSLSFFSCLHCIVCMHPDRQLSPELNSPTHRKIHFQKGDPLSCC